MAPPIVNARNIRNGWGVNAGGSGSEIANALGFINTRLIRSQFDGDTTGYLQGIQNALVSAGLPDPNLNLNLLLNGYYQNAVNNQWNTQRNWILTVNNIKGPNGKSILKAIEGPNEMNSRYTGDGCRAPNGVDRIWGGGDGSADDAVCDANLVDWAREVFNWKQANLTALQNVELCSGCVLYYYIGNWSTNLNCSQYVDYGTIHYYSPLGGGNGTPSWAPNPNNFSNYYPHAQFGLCPGKALIQTEMGASMQQPGGYSQDGRSACRSILLQILDHFVKGGHRIMIYNLFNNPNNTPPSNVAGTPNVPGNPGSNNEDNFGLYWGNKVAKPATTMLHNLGNLLSIGNSYSDSRNFNDVTSFTPSYTGANLTITGMANAGQSGNCMVMPKSDGSTMVAVWNEPDIEFGSNGGASLSCAANNITVNFGSSQTYKVYDVMGGGNVDAFTVSTSLTPITTGTGSSVNLTLYGNPLFIEFPVNPVTTVPGATTVTVSQTTATEVSLTWTQATQSPDDYLITVTEL